MIAQALNLLAEGQDLGAEQMTATMRSIMQGEATAAQLGGLLLAWRVKGETAEEITAAARVLRELSLRVASDATKLVDTCGTGGDGANTFNISTTAAFVTAAAGATVAKHGNRSVSSTCGSADVLEAAGVNLHLSAAEVSQCLQQVGIAFLFAPEYHAAMKHARQVRAELGVRTLFNLLGPLINPAAAEYQVIGVYDVHWLLPIASALRELGSRHVLVVHAEDGLDEISIAAPTRVAELREGKIKEYVLTPAELGVTPGRLDSIVVNNSAESLEKMLAVLRAEPGAAQDIVCLNAGAAIYVAGLESSLAAGVACARRVIGNGEALRKLEELIAFTVARDSA